MKIKVSQNAGFCFGVGRAIDKVITYAKANKNKKIKSYGMLIHNNYVIEKLKNLNIEVLENIDDVQKDNVIFIRSHGIPKEEMNLLSQKAQSVIDCTCPYVKKIHNIVEEYSNNGYDVLVIGDKSHPEVVGIISYINSNRKYFIANNLDEVINALKGNLLNNEKLIVVSQTTFDLNRWSEIEEYIKSNFDVLIFNTICNATHQRQTEAVNLAKTVDIMLIIGDRKSSNTNKLYNICSKMVKSVFIEDINQLKDLDLSKYEKIGITAGASTSTDQINDIIDYLDKKYNQQDNISMDEVINFTFKKIQVGQIIKGKVLKITDDYILLDIGYKAEGIIYKNDFIKNIDIKLNTIVNIGDIIEAKVIKEYNNEGNVVLSKIEADIENGIAELLEKFNNNIPIPVVVKQIKEKSIETDFRGVKVYISFNQWGEEFSQSIIGKKFDVLITKFDSEKGIAFGSRKNLIRLQFEKAFDSIYGEIDFQKTYEGTIVKIVEKGLIIGFNGLQGFVPLSEISYTNNANQLKNIYSIGEKVNVKVLNIDKENKRIFLSIKKTQPDPWIEKANKLYLGQIITCKVKKIHNFGIIVAFDDIDAFVHISNIALSNNQPLSSAFHIGDEIKAKIIEIDVDKRKISLSLKDIEEYNKSEEYKDDFVITLADLIKNNNKNKKEMK
ncbi:4-hydroxy-3-methylbut-2-enyl diphosphate reductase [Caldicellulosiruptoraceae bacterium PP1]